MNSQHTLKKKVVPFQRIAIYKYLLYTWHPDVNIFNFFWCYIFSLKEYIWKYALYVIQNNFDIYSSQKFFFFFFFCQRVCSKINIKDTWANLKICFFRSIIFNLPPGSNCPTSPVCRYPSLSNNSAVFSGS